ncbi:hypothetical protein [Streptomyces sp. NPDC051684]|uniref:hypothetical protein n=1 Tax=Streptomyces sp. NPDC051684 TaxID=3365670 RepID=UPI0037A9B105
MSTTPAPRWNWHALDSADRLDPVPATLDEARAQDACNFVLWRPTALPAGCDTAIGTLRREAPPGRVEAAGRTPWSDANPACYRTEIGGGGRRLRLKQFLYDWAFPAVDHPCLWGGATRAVPIGERRVAWLGTDYLGHRAASARMAKTTVELSVLEGEFDDEELVDLYAALRPAVPEALPRVLATPFAGLSYWARHRAAPVAVPTGVFAFQRRGRTHEEDWVPADALEDFLDAHGLPNAVGAFRADSAARCGDGDTVREVDVVYTSPTGDELRLTAQRPGAGRLAFPPVRDKHPAQGEILDLDGRRVHLGCVSAEFGACDAWWRHPAGHELRLLSSAGQDLGRDAFVRLLTALDAGLRPAREGGTPG